MTGTPLSNGESSECARKGIPGQRAGGAATRGGVGETGAPAGGEPVAKLVHRHAATRSHLADSDRTIRDGPRRRDFLRSIPHDEARVQTAGSGRGTSDADVRGRGVLFYFSLWENLRESSHAVVVRRNTDCSEICAVAAMIEYRQAAASMQWALAEGSGFLFPSVRDNEEKGNLALTPAQMTANLQAHLHAAGMEDKRYALHSFRLGGAASHHMDGTAIDVLMEYVGWTSAEVAGRYVGVTASAARSRGAKRSRDTAFIDAGALPLSGGFGDSYVAFPWDNRGHKGLN